MKKIFTIFMLGLTTVLFGQIPTTNLVAYYPFNGNANDGGPLGLNGTLNGPVLTTDRFGNPNSAYHFDGVDDEIWVNDHDSLSFPDNAFTFGFWIKTNGDTQYGVFSKRENPSGGSGWEYNYYRDNASMGLATWNGGGSCVAYSYGLNLVDSINLSTWEHYVITANGDSSWVFKNGVLMEATPRNATCSMSNLNGELKLGVGGNWGNSFFLDGDLDDIVIYSRALTPCEVTQLYYENVPQITVVENNAISCFGGNDGVLGLNIQNAAPPYTYLWSDGQTTQAASNLIAGTYSVDFYDGAGCSLTSIYGLTEPTQITGTDAVTSCDSLTWIDGVTYYSNNNSATHTLTSSLGCDSVVTLDLTINQSTYTPIVISACDSYVYDGVTYVNDTVGPTITGTGSNGCPAYYVLDLTIRHSTASTDVQTACDSYTWMDGNTYTASNNSATHTLTNSVGCDSVITLDLTILNSTSSVDQITACDSYTWMDGITYSVSNNTATHTLTNSVGCDSVITLDLTILNSTSSVDQITACNNYTWIDGNTYTTSNNTATHTLTNAAGCDSVVTLDLTIATPTTGIDQITACNSYTWIDGNTYTASNNTATHTLTNAAGCDSVVTLDLTIATPTTGIDQITACNSYTWIDGNTYTASNNSATHTLTNAAGCDSVVTLDLTINSVSDLSTSLSGLTITANNASATAFQWLDCDDNHSVIMGETGASFTAISNGNYAVELTENGCVDTSACIAITDVGIEENTFGKKLMVYPNPTTGNFSIDLGTVYESATVMITDVSGKLIQSKTITQAQVFNFNLQAPAGIYFVSVQTGDKMAEIKLVKQ